MVDTQLPISLEVIDSHTEGEPTRCVISGGPDLGSGPLAGRIVVVRQQHLLATSFHPELTGDGRIHGYFCEMVRTRA